MDDNPIPPLTPLPAKEPAAEPGAAPAAAADAEPIAPAAPDEDRTVAIVAYLTLLGFIAAVFLHGQKKTAFGAYHLRQALGLVLTWLAVAVVSFIPVLGHFAGSLCLIGLLALLVFGLIAAINGEEKPVPVLGALFEEWFGNAFD
jgi:uncharacterized membrane protein